LSLVSGLPKLSGLNGRSCAYTADVAGAHRVRNQSVNTA
jgi:hypothetical protein